MASDLSLDLVQVQAALSRWFTEQSRQGFFATDRRFRVIVWNRWMEIHSGHSAAKVLGRSLFDLYPDLTARGTHEHYNTALSGHITVISQGLHRYVLALPPTNANLPFTEMPQSGHIGPLSNGGEIIGTVTILRTSAIDWPARHNCGRRSKRRSSRVPRRRRLSGPKMNSSRRCPTKSDRP